MKASTNTHDNASPDTTPGPGSLLKNARESAGMDRRAVAAKLRLDLKVIVALEEDDFTALPAATFVRGYLHNYTQLLDLPTRPVFEALDNAQLSHPQLIADIAEAPQVRTSDMPVRLASYGVIAVLTIMIVLWWQNQDFDYRELLQTDSGLNQSTPPASMEPATEVAGKEPDVVTQQPQVAIEEAIPPSAVTNTATQTSPPLVDATPAITEPENAAIVDNTLDSVAQPAAEPAPQTGNESTLIDQQLNQAQKSIEASENIIAQNQTANESPSPAQAHDIVAATTVTEPVTTAPASPPQSPDTSVNTGNDTLSMHFSRESWVTVYDGNEKRLFYNLTRPDQTLELSGPGPLRVLLGRPQGVTVLYNGKSLDIKPYVSNTGIARFTGNN